MRTTRTAATVAILAVAIVVGGCTTVSELVNPPKPVVVQLQVWNRTLDPVFVVNQKGQRLDVPGCGHAIADRFEVNRVEVRTEHGFYFGAGTTGAGDAGRPQSMIITATPGDSRDAADSAALPPCEGHPQVQPGVTFRVAD
jgi:hypothetical protein